jgi:hypothetical protein
MNEIKALGTEACQLKFAADGQAEADTMTIEGYASTFGNVDAYGDVVAPGAFAKTIAQHKTDGTMPKLLLQHDGFGALPVGKWTDMHEDSHGLYVKGKLFNTTAGRDTYEVLKQGGVDGLSIGFRPTEFAMRAKPEDPKRTLKSVDLMEVSVVTFPANGKARVLSVKSADQVMTIRDLETALEERGFSRAEARNICARFESKSELEERKAADELLRAANELMARFKA